MTTSQLRLVAARTDWKLDNETKEIGRRGVQMARQALHSHTKTEGSANDRGSLVRGMATQERLAA